MSNAYSELIRRSKELGVLHSCAAVLAWDQQTYMPANGANLRGEQMALLASLAHQKFTDPRIGELLAAVEGSALVKDPESDAAANARELRRNYDRATKLPQSLVEELARVTTQAQQVWQIAKAKNDFAQFQPWLEKVVALKRQEAAAVGFKDHPYNALIEEYEPGTTVADLKVIFAGLTTELVPLIRKIADSGKKPDASILQREYPIDRQKIFAESAAVAFGFDFAAGRLDTTAHPFCSGMGAPATAASRRATTRASSASRSSACCMRPATRYTNRTYRRSTSARRSASRVRSASTNRNRGSGRTRSAAAGPSGTTSSRGCGKPSPPPSPASASMRSASPSTT